MKILIIDNHLDPATWGAKDLLRLAKLAENPLVMVRRGPQEDLPESPAAFDRVIVSGSKMSILEDSPWVENLFEFIRKTIDAGVPYLGVCYGYQALVRSLGGKSAVRRSEQPEFGWTRIEVREPSSLLKGLPREFYSFSAHFEEAAKLPPGMKQLAHSDFCEIQACQLEGKPVFGIQFHPEKPAETADRVLQERKKLGDPPILLHPDQTKKLYDPKIGETLFKNFLISE